MKAIGTLFTLFSIGMVVLLLAACCSPATSEPTLTAIFTSKPSATQTLGLTVTITPSMDATQQTWYSTASAIQKTELAASQQNWDEKKAKIAEFQVNCERVNDYYSELSPDENWAAVSCGNKINQTLIVQNRDGTQWVLDFKDFLSPEIPENIMGILGAKFWSLDSGYLFFTLGLGYDGGGDYCFPTSGDYGDYGLFRLDVNTGEWVVLIPSTNNFPGYEIEFSTNGKWYAATLNGITITDLQTGVTRSITTEGIVERLLWSPDGTSLAYSLASCDEIGVKSSETNIWNERESTKLIMDIDDQVLRPEYWVDDQTLRIISEKIRGLDTFYTIYLYDMHRETLIFTGTATPYP